MNQETQIIDLAGERERRHYIGVAEQSNLWKLMVATFAPAGRQISDDDAERLGRHIAGGPLDPDTRALILEYQRSDKSHLFQVNEDGVLTLAVPDLEPVDESCTWHP